MESKRSVKDLRKKFEKGESDKNGAPPNYRKSSIQLIPDVLPHSKNPGNMSQDNSKKVHTHNSDDMRRSGIYFPSIATSLREQGNIQHSKTLEFAFDRQEKDDATSPTSSSNSSGSSFGKVKRSNAFRSKDLDLAPSEALNLKKAAEKIGKVGPSTIGLQRQPTFRQIPRQDFGPVQEVIRPAPPPPPTIPPPPVSMINKTPNSKSCSRLPATPPPPKPKRTFDHDNLEQTFTKIYEDIYIHKKNQSYIASNPPVHPSYSPYHSKTPKVEVSTAKVVQIGQNNARVESLEGKSKFDTHKPLARSQTESALLNSSWNKILMPNICAAQSYSQMQIPDRAGTPTCAGCIPYYSPPSPCRSMEDLTLSRSSSASGLVLFNLESDSDRKMKMRPYPNPNPSPTYLRSTPLSPITPSGSKDAFVFKIPSSVKLPRGDRRLGERSKSDWNLIKVPSNCQSTPKQSSRDVHRGKSPAVSRNLFPTLSNGTSTGHPSLESTGSSTNESNLINNKPVTAQQQIQNLVNALYNKEATSSTDSGIQIRSGSDSLSSCETPVGDSTTDTGDSDIENEGETVTQQVVERRKSHLIRVNSEMERRGISTIDALISASKCKMPISKSRLPNHEPLFECLLIVGIVRDLYTRVSRAYRRDVYPPNAKLPCGLEQFCCPDAMDWPFNESHGSEFYTLAITDQSGGRKYGYCLRVRPEASEKCIPIVYCCISQYRAFGFYNQVLQELASLHGYGMNFRKFWYEAFYTKSFPASGGCLTVTGPTELPSNNRQNYRINSAKTITIKRKADARLDEIELVSLFNAVPVTTVIKIFAAMLLERKIILVSRNLSTLSFCVEALETLLYPFSWQHTFIPIVPLNLTDVLDAPSPYIMGVLKSSHVSWDNNCDERLVVDLEDGKILSAVNDESSILPKEVVKKLKNALQKAMQLKEPETTMNALISECFIRTFIELVGHHLKFIVVQQDGTKIFETQSFIKSAKTKDFANFLHWFCETAIFKEFIKMRIENKFPDQFALFDQRVLMHEMPQGQNTGGGTTFKNAKNFMNRTRPFGNWLKEAFVK